MKQARVVIAILLLVVAAGGLWFAIQSGHFGPVAGSSRDASQPKIGGPFELVNHWGDKVTSADYSDGYMLLSFGYTYCPDVCPTTLSTISTALDILGGDASKITPLFVTVDPERDTPQYLQEYLQHFHPAIVGLTGDPNQIKKVTKAYGVYYAKVQEDGADPDDYLMDHTSLVFLMDKEGRYKAHFSHGGDAETMAARLKEMLAGAGS